MRKRTTLIVLTAVLGGTVTVLGSSPALSVPAKANRLLRFSGCGDYLDYMKQNALPSVSPTGFLDRYGVEAVGPPPPPVFLPPVTTPGSVIAAPATTRSEGEANADDASTTNVQEAGVDEPDIVKSNGRTLFALAGANIHSVGLNGDRPRLLDTISVKNDADRHELLLHRGALLVLSHDTAEEAVPRRWPQSSVVPSPIPPPPPPPPTTTLTHIDVGSSGAMKIVERLVFEGQYVSARLANGTARVVLKSSVPQDLRFAYPRYYAAPQEALERNRAVISSSRARNWLPSYELRKVRSKTRRARSVQCRHVSRPPAFSGFGVVTVLTIDLDKGLEPVETDAVLGDGDIVYASPSSLYVATQRWSGRPVRGLPSRPARLDTALHKFDISPADRTAYRASGTVPGYLLNQWSLSEHEGVLRVASTQFPNWWEGRAGESTVTALRERSGGLVEAGRVSGLGRGERIFGVRFIGDVGYVVTFRQTDPLYTIDLSRPESPKLLGELKIPGYSAYLHPLGANLLLGLGQDATDIGGTTGTQLSVFDVSDLKKPTRLHHRTIDGGVSEAETDHHAFLYWPRSKLAVVPLETYSRAGREFDGVIGFRIGRDGLHEAGRISHGSGTYSDANRIRRTLVMGGKLLTVSAAGVKASDLQSFRNEGWVSFRAARVSASR